MVKYESLSMDGVPFGTGGSRESLNQLIYDMVNTVNRDAESGWRVHTWTVTPEPGNSNYGRLDVLLERAGS